MNPRPPRSTRTDTLSPDTTLFRSQVDGRGDDIPPGELNRQTSKGQHFGFPWYGGGDVRTHQYADSEPPADVVFPAVAMPAPADDLGMHFYRGDQSPPHLRAPTYPAPPAYGNQPSPDRHRVLFEQYNQHDWRGQTR